MPSERPNMECAALETIYKFAQEQAAASIKQLNAPDKSEVYKAEARGAYSAYSAIATQIEQVLEEEGE